MPVQDIEMWQFHQLVYMVPEHLSQKVAEEKGVICSIKMAKDLWKDMLKCKGFSQ